MCEDSSGNIVGPFEPEPVQNPLPLAGEGRVRAPEIFTGRAEFASRSPHPNPLPQAGEGDGSRFPPR
jgi:hypothetical protein